MITDQKKFLTGAKYSALAISLSVLVSPILYLLMLFLQAERDYPGRPYGIVWVPLEIYFAVGIAVFVFFLLPYLIGGGVLGLLVAHLKTTSPGLLGVVVGSISGLAGLLLMASLIWRAEIYRTIDWPTIWIVEVWSTIVFIPIAYRLKKILMPEDF